MSGLVSEMVLLGTVALPRAPSKSCGWANVKCCAQAEALVGAAVSPMDS